MVSKRVLSLEDRHLDKGQIVTEKKEKKERLASFFPLASVAHLNYDPLNAKDVLERLNRLEGGALLSSGTTHEEQKISGRKVCVVLKENVCVLPRNAKYNAVETSLDKSS